MKYKLSPNVFERKTLKTGKQVIEATVEDERGVRTEKVTLWQDFPNFSNLIPGDSVIADLVIKQNGQYENKTLYPGKTYNSFQGKGPTANMEKKAETITKAMDRKEQGIQKFQDTKEYGIMVASTANMATQILTAQGFQPDEYQEKWLKIRYWLVENYENVSQPKIAGTDIDYPQEDRQPNFEGVGVPPLQNGIDEFPENEINPNDIPF